jgi:diamine N-acetyltransferase
MIGKRVILRAPEPSDINFLYAWENDRSVWRASNTNAPYSRFAIEQYVMNAQLDIYSTRQLRFMIDKAQPEDQLNTIGTIDLYDFEPAHRRAGLGVLIISEERGKGYASEALELLIDYAFNTLNLHQLFSHISSSNIVSLNLFAKHKFEMIGLKKEWLLIDNQWVDEYILQRINTHEKI